MIHHFLFFIQQLAHHRLTNFDIFLQYENEDELLFADDKGNNQDPDENVSRVSPNLFYCELYVFTLNA